MIDRLGGNGIDLTGMPVEVAPIAHYHMGGVKADAAHGDAICRDCSSAGEAVGGANGANRLSGNAVTEALVFGRRAGRSAAAARRHGNAAVFARKMRAALDLVRADGDAATAATPPR